MTARYPINLASEPFRRDRPMFVASVALAVVLGLMLSGLITMALLQFRQASDARVALADLRTRHEALGREQAKLSQSLARAENAVVLERSLFLNGLIARKGVSWTLLFGDLESVIPHNVRLMSVRPQIDAANRIQLELMVGAEATQPVIDMLMKLEQSASFGKTTIVNWLPPSQNEPLYRYRVTVNYAQKL